MLRRRARALASQLPTKYTISVKCICKQSFRSSKREREREKRKQQKNKNTRRISRKMCKECMMAHFFLLLLNLWLCAVLFSASVYCVPGTPCFPIAHYTSHWLPLLILERPILFPSVANEPNIVYGARSYFYVYAAIRPTSSKYFLFACSNFSNQATVVYTIRKLFTQVFRCKRERELANSTYFLISYVSWRLICKYLMWVFFLVRP